MLALFSIALALRLRENAPSSEVLIGLESTGFILTGFAGWMGGTLVCRNQIGIDPRYAFAGKWKEEYLTEHSGRIAAAKTDDLKRDQMKLVHVFGKRIAIARTEEGYVAFEDHCSHKGGSLAGGMMICGTVQCPWHGSQFNVRTGDVNAGPATEKILTYKIEAVNNILYLSIK